MIVREALAEARRKLAGQPAGDLEADVLLRHALQVDRAWLYANGERELESRSENCFRELVERRFAGEPIAYITGVREFWSLPLHVTPDVLIPRSDTELLVEIGTLLGRGDSMDIRFQVRIDFVVQSHETAGTLEIFDATL